MDYDKLMEETLANAKHAAQATAEDVDTDVPEVALVELSGNEVAIETNLGSTGTAVLVNPDDLKVTKGTIIRTVCFIVSWINAICAFIGLPQLDIPDNLVIAVVEGVYAAATAIFLFGANLVAAWKNQSYTKGALVGDVAMNTYRAEVDGD